MGMTWKPLSSIAIDHSSGDSYQNETQWTNQPKLLGWKLSPIVFDHQLGLENAT